MWQPGGELRTTEIRQPSNLTFAIIDVHLSQSGKFQTGGEKSMVQRLFWTVESWGLVHLGRILQLAFAKLWQHVKNYSSSYIRKREKLGTWLLYGQPVLRPGHHRANS